MRYFCLTILLILTISNTVFSQKSDKKTYLSVNRHNNREKDSIENLKIITHGVYVEFLGRSTHIYSIGYEYAKSKGINSGGFNAGFGINPINVNRIIGSKKYSNIHLGFGGFYDLGKQFGMRIATYLSYNFTPVMFTNKLNSNTLHSDMPYIQSILFSPILGLFYRTKNHRWQIILSGMPYFSLADQVKTISLSKKWSSPGFVGANFEISVKYN